MESVVNASRRRALQLLAGAPMLPLSSTLAGTSLLLAGFGAAVGYLTGDQLNK